MVAMGGSNKQQQIRQQTPDKHLESEYDDFFALIFNVIQQCKCKKETWYLISAIRDSQLDFILQSFWPMKPEKGKDASSLRDHHGCLATRQGDAVA